MTQQKVYNFGDTLTQGKAKTLTSRLFSPGIYDGMTPVVTGPATVSLSSGAFLLPNGVLVVESATIDSVSIPTLVAVSGFVDLTLTADHSDIQATGGSPVSYTLREGRFESFGDPNTNSLALLWIRYEIGFPLDASMFELPQQLKTGSVLSALQAETGWIAGPFADMCDVTNGPNITQQRVSHLSGPHNTGLLLVNSSMVSAQAFNFTVQLPSTPRARSIDVYGTLPVGATVGFQTAQTTLNGAAAAGTAVTIPVVSTADLTTGDRVLLVDPTTSFREIIIVGTIFSAVQFQTATLFQSFTSGTVVRSLSTVTSEDGEVVTATPSSFAGPATGLVSAIGRFSLASTTSVPRTLGVRVLVPPGGSASAVFLKGFRVVGE